MPTERTLQKRKKKVLSRKRALELGLTDLCNVKRRPTAGTARDVPPTTTGFITSNSTCPAVRLPEPRLSLVSDTTPISSVAEEIESIHQVSTTSVRAPTQPPTDFSNYSPLQDPDPLPENSPFEGIHDDDNVATGENGHNGIPSSTGHPSSDDRSDPPPNTTCPQPVTIDGFAIPHKEQQHEPIFKLCSIASRRNLTDACMNDMIEFMNNERCRDAIYKIPTLHAMEKVIGITDFKADFYWPCPECQGVKITSAFQTPYKVKCCEKIINPVSPQFYMLNLSEQVKLAVEGCQFFEPTTGKSRELQTYGYDSARDILLSINTDGTPIYSSSNSSLWPVLVSVNSIGYLEKKRRIIVWGVWISKGSGKPDFIILLKYLTQLVLTLQPVEWMDKSGVNRESKLYVESALCDSIARPAVQFMNQFNSEYGCGYCYHKEPGHYFSHRLIDSRTHEAHATTCTEIATTGVGRLGVLGRSPLMDIPYFDIILDFPIDILHAVYLGVVNTMTELWFSKKSAGKPYNLNQKSLEHIDKTLLDIKPPNRISRLPRSLSQRKSFKGHEWSMWFSYYSPIILGAYLPSNYFNHWILLVNAIALLNSTCPMPEEIDRAELLLNDFSMDMEKLYDRKACRFNVHLLRHLPVFVRRFGPLHNFTMIVFESFNRILKSYVSSPNGVGLQIIKRHLKEVVLRKITCNSNKSFIEVTAFHSICDIFPICKQMLIENFGSLNDMTFFKTVVINNRKLTSKSGIRSKKRLDYVFWTETGTVFETYFYFKHNNLMFAAGLNHVVCESHVQVDHIFKATSNCCLYMLATEFKDRALKIKNQYGVHYLRFINNVECYAE